MRGVHRTLGAGMLAALLAVAVLAAPPGWGGPGEAAAAATAKPGQAKLKLRGFAAGTSGSGTGIVQAVFARGVVVRELDGSIARVRVAPRTRVFVNGVRAALSDVRPGFVVRFTGVPGKAARLLRALDPSQARVTIG